MLFWVYLAFFFVLGGFVIGLELFGYIDSDITLFDRFSFCLMWGCILLSFLYPLLIGSLTPTYRLEPDAIVTRWRGREYRLRWADCVEYGYVSIASGRSSSVPTVYFSDHWLEPKKKK